MRTGYRRWRRTTVDITPRQAEVLRLIERGLTNGEIAIELGITLDGVKFHVSEILAKLGVSSREEAVGAWRHSRSFPTLVLPSTGVLRWAAVSVTAVGGVLLLGTLFVLFSRGESPEPAAPNPTVSATPTSPPTPTATATVESLPGYRRPREVGVLVLDEAMTAASAPDARKLIELIAPRLDACAEIPQGPIPAPPKCPPGVAEGELVPTVTVLGGEASRMVADGNDPALLDMVEGWLGSDRRVYAVKELDLWEGADYAIIFAARPNGCPDCVAGNALLLAEDGIVAFLFDPVNSIPFTDESLTGSYLLPPP